MEAISEVAWAGIRSEILARVSDGSFGASYPEACQDGASPVGTDEMSFWNAMRSRIPTLAERPWYHGGDVPLLNDIMDVVQFCWSKIGQPQRRGYHEYFKHFHLTFDIAAGREEFRQTINEIFRRSGLAYELLLDGTVHRLLPPVFREAIIGTVFRSGDPTLDQLLETARRKFVDPDETVRRESVEKLWDAFERLKTVEEGNNKRDRIGRLLDIAAASTTSGFRQALEREARELTDIGNQFLIRHTETTQEPLSKSLHVDYVFHRLFSLLLLLLHARQGASAV
jgi:hypothetical protein